MSFIHDDFILKSETARLLYHKYAENLPIIDYHCHINPQEIYENRKFENITQVWLGGDHYKWRLIRSAGVPEEEVTGGAEDRLKFQRFAEILPRAVGNPMYAWCHLELKRYFGYDGTLSAKTAEEVWNLCNEKLKDDSLTSCGIIKKSNVKMIGTTDDPIDSLEWHKKIAESGCCTAKVLPSFRPDKAVNIDKAGFAEYIAKLGEAAGFEIKTAADVKKALSGRLEFFCSLGCKVSDHGLDYVPFVSASDEEVEAIFQKGMKGEKLSACEADAYKTAMLLHMGREYSKHDIVMQLHYGVQRNTNSRKFSELGPDTGYDCISVKECGLNVAALLNALEAENNLPKTILYSLNPHDNELLDTICGGFQQEGVVGRVQHGSAWWFNDTKSGMEAQLRSFANLSLLGNFVGMLTDSRSFLSYTRHEYFRRILCNFIGELVENGEYPNDEETLGSIVEDICYYNAARFFGV